MSAERSCYSFGPFRLDPSEQLLLRDGRPVPLTPKVFDVLRILVDNAGHLVPKDRLLAEVWAGSFVEEGNLARSVSVLRKALGPSEYIETHPKRGYRFVAVVTRYSPESVPRPTRDVPASNTPSLLRSIAGRAAVVLIGSALIAFLLYMPRLVSGRPDDTEAGGATPVHRQVTFRGGAGSAALSPDGQRIAYVSMVSRDEHALVIQALSNGPPLELLRAPELGRPRWSPDGTELLFWARGDGKDGLYVVSQFGGVPRLIGRRAFVGAWSPDGSSIAVPRPFAPAISFIDRDGQELRRASLQGTFTWIFDLDWSADRMAFAASDNEGRHSLWTIRSDGSEQRRCLVEPTEISSVRWDARGDAVYYLRRLRQTASLFKLPVTLPATPGNAVPSALLTGLDSDGTFGLSADGSSLVYARAPFHSNLWLAEVHGSGAQRRIRTRQLTHGTAHVERPLLSPDGQAVLYNVGDESTSHLYRLSIIGGDPRQLTFANALSLGGVWSPDGTHVAFGSTDGGRARVWVVSAEGGTPRPLSSGHFSDSFEIAWFAGAGIFYQEAGNRNFYALDPEMGDERLLLKDSSNGWISAPVLSPDGTEIAVGWNRSPTRGIWSIDRHTSRERLVWADDSVPAPIGWSSDGRWIHALTGKGGQYRGIGARFGGTRYRTSVLRIARDGSSSETLVELPFDEVGGVTMTPDGRRFVCSVYSSRSDVWIVEHFDPAAARARR